MQCSFFSHLRWVYWSLCRVLPASLFVPIYRSPRPCRCPCQLGKKSMVSTVSILNQYCKLYLKKQAFGGEGYVLSAHSVWSLCRSIGPKNSPVRYSFFFLPTSHDYYTVHTDKTRPKPHPKYSSSFFSFSFLLSLSIPFPCTFK